MNPTTPNLYTSGLTFDQRYLEHRSYYMALYNGIPDINLMSPLNGEKAFAAFCEMFGSHIEQVHAYRWYKPKKKAYHFDRTIVRLKERITIEFDRHYCEMLHDGQCPELIDAFTSLFDRFRERQRREPREINLIVKGPDGPELKAMEIRRTRLDIDLYYEDDFAPVDAVIRSRLARKNDKGIVLLHGLPGTGKTSYLRYLVGRTRKEVLFLSPSVAGDLMHPSFIQLLIDHPNSILIVEDAEQIISDRSLDRSSPVSNLLNISDGMLADFLNVQLICTFNSPLTMVDSALLRQGRLIARYCFGKLSREKAQRLSEHAGISRKITGPMTLAEIMNPGEPEQAPQHREVIGFRRNLQVQET